MSFFGHRGRDPFGDVTLLRRNINRLFEEATGIGRQPTAFLPGRAARAYPLVNLTENADTYHVEALAPGLDTEKLEIAVRGNVLTIAGAKEGMPDLKPETIHRSERSGGTFARTLELPLAVEVDDVTARYQDGILRIDLPKHEALRPKQISVTVT